MYYILAILIRNLSFVFQDIDGDLLNSIWCEFNKSTCKDNALDGMLLEEKSVNVKDYLISGCANKSKERFKKSTRDALIDKPLPTNLKFNRLTAEDTLRILNFSATEVQSLLIPQTLTEDTILPSNSDNNENPNMLGSEFTRRKPYATVESEQSKEMEPNSQSASGTNTTDDNVEADIMIVDNVGCEEIELSVISTGCDSDQHQPEDQSQEPVFEDITEEISQGDTSTHVFLDLNGQLNIPDNILNTLNISQETEQVVPLIKNPASSNPPNPQNCEGIVEGQLGSIENKAEYVSLGRREDCFNYNDTMLSRFFSEGNADEGTDDESSYINRHKYAGGGKVHAFREQLEDSRREQLEDSRREQLEDSRSDVGEECESSPSNRSLEPPSPGNNFQDLDSLTDIPSHRKMSDKSQIAIQEEGTCQNIALHNRTQQDYKNYSTGLLGSLDVYVSTPNILFSQTSPSPYFAFKKKTKICHCKECEELFETIKFNWTTISRIRYHWLQQMQQILAQTATNVIEYENKVEVSFDKGVESKILDMTEADQKSFSTHCEVSNSASASEDNQQLLTLKVPQESKNTNVTKTDYSNLPPKKRKAFNLQLSESMEQEKSANTEPKIAKMDFQHQDEIPLDHRLKQSEESLPTNNCPKNSELTKDCSVVVKRLSQNRLTGVVIKTVDGKTFAEPKTSSITECSDNNSDEGKVKKKRSKSACKHSRRKKEERRLQKELKRLKKEKKREEMMLNSTI